jgi:hypothetical protein
MEEMSEAENTQRIINKIFDDIAKCINEERERVERGYAHSSPFWNGYVTALDHFQDAVEFWKNEEEAALTDALTPADDGFKPDVEIKRVQDLMCDLARLLIDNPTEYLLTTDVARGIKETRDLINVLNNIGIDLQVKDNPAQNEDERTTDAD